MEDEDSPSLAEFAATPEKLRKLVNLFIQQSEETLDVLTKNCSDGPNQAWADAAHKFKGAAAVARAEKLAALCDGAQKMTTATAAQRTALLGEIAAAYSKVKASLLNSLSPAEIV